jgi:tetratricopeptide (TPR) repeat protein
MDPLSDLLRMVRLDGAYFYCVEAAEPWSVSTRHARELAPRIMPGSDHLIPYHGREVPALYQAKHRGALERTWAAIHLAEGRPLQALQAIERSARQYPVGYVSFDASMIRLDEHPELARAYDRAGFPDSAIAVYKRFLATPALERVELDAFELPDALFRLAELYERRSARAAAARYYLRFAELWKDADPALQPRVALARRRAAALGSRP